MDTDSPAPTSASSAKNDTDEESNTTISRPKRRAAMKTTLKLELLGKIDYSARFEYEAEERKKLAEILLPRHGSAKRFKRNFNKFIGDSSLGKYTISVHF